MSDITQTEPAPSHFHASLMDLRGSLKWLVAVSGAALAVLVAGAQLRDIPPGTGAFKTAIALMAATAAISVVFLLLVRASYVLTIRRPTAVDLANMEAEDGYIDRPGSLPKNSLLRWVLQNRVYLLGDAASVSALYTEQYVRPINTLRALDEHHRVEWRRVMIDGPGTSAQRADIEAAVTRAQDRIALVEEAVHYAETERRYRRLVKFWFPWAAVLVTGCVAAFTTATLSEAGVPVAEPYPVVVSVLDPATAGVPPCHQANARGFAVGGTLSSPDVVLNAAGPDCPAVYVPSSTGIIVIPEESDGS